jgi:hypothetical protein
VLTRRARRKDDVCEDRLGQGALLVALGRQVKPRLGTGDRPLFSGRGQESRAERGNRFRQAGRRERPTPPSATKGEGFECSSNVAFGSEFLAFTHARLRVSTPRGG